MQSKEFADNNLRLKRDEARLEERRCKNCGKKARDLAELNKNYISTFDGIPFCSENCFREWEKNQKVVI